MKVTFRPVALTAAMMGLTVALVACGTTSTSSGGSTAATQSSAPGAEAAAGGEAGVVSWTDPQHRYRVDSPGAMTVAADGSASAIRPAERLEIAIVQGSSASDPMRLAQSDVTSLKASAADFRLLSGPSSVDINGRQVVKVLYEWTAGTNAVTGKPTKLTTARYYIPRDRGRLGVLTYGIASNQYDPQGADDVEISFTWLS